MIGQQIGSYRVLAQLGQGGMGAVYVAEHALIGRRAAIKVLLPEVSRDAAVVQRFFNEARATAAIKHPGLIDIFDFGYLDSGCAFIAMELLEGESLAARLRRLGPLPVELVAVLGRQIAGALGAAHAKGIVHRDLKPDNIFLCPDDDAAGRVRTKVLDFGIAKLAVGAEGVARTRTGVVIGTPLYMSPEQCRGAADLDHRADIYSLGCVLYEMACGQPPFVREGLTAIITAHVLDPPPSPRLLAPGIPSPLEGIILQSLAKLPAQRQQSMELLRAQLDHVVPQPAPRSFAPPPSTNRAAVAAPAVARAGSVSTLGGAAGEAVGPPPTVGAGRRWAIFIGAIGGAGLLSLGAALLLRSPTTDGAVGPDALGAGAPTTAAVAAPAKVRLTLRSSPPGAAVHRADDDELLGQTPLAIDLVKGSPRAHFILRLQDHEALEVSAATDSDADIERTLGRLHGRPRPTKKAPSSELSDPFGKAAERVPREDSPAAADPPRNPYRPPTKTKADSPSAKPAIASPEAAVKPEPQSSGSEADAITSEAVDLYVHGEYQRSLEKARQAITAGGGQKAWRVFGASACFLKQRDEAMRAWNRLENVNRQFVKYVCARQEINLP